MKVQNKNYPYMVKIALEQLPAYPGKFRVR